MAVFLKSLSPITVSNDVSEETRQLYDKFTTDPGFQSLRNQLHKQFPALNDFSILDHIGEEFLDLEILADPKILDTLAMIPGSGLVHGEVNTPEDNVLLYMYFGCFTDLENRKVKSPLYRVVSGKQEIISVANNYPSEKLVAIFMPIQSSKEEFLKWVDEHWQAVKEMASELPMFKVNRIPKNLEIGAEIGQLKSQGLTFNEISTQLFDKYPEDDRLADYGQVKVIYKRYCEYVTAGVVDSIALTSIHK